MNTKILFPYLSIDLSGMFPEFSPDGLVRWAGKVRLTFDNGFGRIDCVTANWAGVELRKDGSLVDFEGNSDDATLYTACEALADVLASEISAVIGYPDRWEAHSRDIAWRKANHLPPFDRAA
jgi:hypothetical protein